MEALKASVERMEASIEAVQTTMEISACFQEKNNINCESDPLYQVLVPGVMHGIPGTVAARW